MPDAVAVSEDRSQEADTKDRSQEADSQVSSQKVDPTDRSHVVEVACPHCDRPTAVSVSNAGAELRVRPYVAAFGEYITARCPDGHAFWIYFC